MTLIRAAVVNGKSWQWRWERVAYDTWRVTWRCDRKRTCQAVAVAGTAADDGRWNRPHTAQCYTSLSLHIGYRVGQKWHQCWHLSFFSHVQFLFSHAIIYIKWLRSSADVNRFYFMRINRNFVTMVGLTNDERCLTHNLPVEFRKSCENAFKQRNTFKLWVINSKW